MKHRRSIDLSLGPGRFVETAAISKHLHQNPWHAAIAAECGQCGALGVLDRKALADRTRGRDAFAEIERRLVCRACGARSARLMVGYLGEAE